MKFKSSSRSTIVPGRRMITNQVAYHQAGIKENTSYLAEKTIAESSSILNDTQDDEERDWRKQGLTEKQIYLRLEDRRLKRIRNAENRLKKEMYGAKDFDELLEKHEYSERESDEEDVTIVAEGHRNIEVFAIPSLPKHLVSDKSMFKSPAVGAKGSGKAGLSCSTPKSANDVSMRSLRSLDISHVVAIDQLDVNRVNVHSKNVLIPIVEHAENSSLQKTFTIQKIQESIERSSTIQKDPETCEISSIQKTIELEEKKNNKSPSNTNESVLPQKASNIDRDTEETEKSSSLQSTFTIAPDAALQLPDIPKIVENALQGGEKARSSKKIGRNVIERRAANISLMSSMIEDIPSPGAGLFKNARKKLRPTIKTPQKTKNNRLSTESDKEKTIEMLSIAEEASVEIESNGPSFVDPISVNGSRVSPTGEAEEATVEIESNSPSFVNPIPVNGSRVSPTREAEEATVEIESNGPLFSDPIPIGQAGESVDVSNSITPKSSRHNQDRSLQVASNSSTGDINLELDVPEHQHDDFDGYEGVRRVDLVEEAEEEEQIDHSPRSKQKSFKRRVALMSDSFASVDIPDLNRPPTRRYMGNETVEDDEWEPEKSEKKKSNRNTGLQLKKRVIIEPATPTDGVRRSKRTRVKPVRSWLNEKAVYVNSPSGGKRLTGVTDVIIKDKRLCKYRTADLKLATEREQKERAVKKKKAAEKRHQLALDHKRGKRLNESQEDILTDEEDGE